MGKIDKIKKTVKKVEFVQKNISIKKIQDEWSKLS